MISSMLRLAGFLLCGLLIDIPSAAASTYFVATNGSDATGTGSMGAPYRTLNFALQQAVSGDVVEVRGGTYREAGEVRFRRPGITMRSYTGEWAVIAAPVDNEEDFSVGVLLDPDADHVTLSRLEISGGYYYGVMLQTKWDWGDPDDRAGACHVVLEDCVIHDTGRDGVKITPNCDDVLIQRCEIYHTGVGPANVSAQNAEGIDCVNGDRVVVRDCSIHDIFSSGLYLKGGAADGLVERTRVDRCGGGGILLGFDTSPEYFDLAVNPRYYENIRGTVRNCQVRETGWEGIGMYAASNPVVFNNTLVDVCTGNVHAALYFGLSYQDWDPAAGRPASVNPTILNNLVAQPAGFSDEMFEIRYSSDLGGMSALAGWPTMDHNGYFIAGGGVARFTDRRPGLELEEGTLAQWRTHAGTDAHSLTGNPVFVDGAVPQLGLRPSSPYVDRGTNAAWMASATDLAGSRRIENAVVDVGARESSGASILIDHRHADITQLTEAQIVRAKEVLHIAYGHTSHGSQLTDGMSGLVDFANGGGKGLALPPDLFAWNDGGSGGALDLHDYAMGGDVGYYPDWVRNTTNYLNNPANADVNVVVWSWCGQMGDKYAAGTLSSEYLLPMADLERRYPDVVFVYMTGHVDIWDDADNKAACAAIRTWCASNSRVLYDFNDIERYDPDGTYYEFVGDDCSVYAGAGGAAVGNWATAWQASHTEGVDWYNCSSAHSEPLNANQKAYAAWALWCRLAESQQTPVLSVTPLRRSVGFAAGTTTFAVANAGGGAMTYSAAESESWLSIQSGAGGGDSGTITVAHVENPSKVARTGTVTVTASGAIGSPVSATVVQDPVPFQDPFPSAVPWPAPGTVEMEDFDMGTPGMAYFDTTAANEGAQYRPSDGVDIAQDAGAGNSHAVGWTRAGEWMEYTVEVDQPGTYALETRVAAVGSGGQFRIRIDGVDQTGLLSVPNTGAWTAYQVVRKTGVALVSGIQMVRVEMVTAGTSGYVGAFDWFRVAVDAPVVQSAYPVGAPWALPGTVEVENFDLGGQGVAYSDVTSANEGGQYRSSDGVDIANDAGAGNGRVVGWTKAGDWMEYTVDVNAGGTYVLETRVAAVGAGGQFRIWVDGADKSGLLNVPNTGAWNAYQVVQKTGVALSSGIQTVRVEMVTAGASGHVGAFDWFRVAVDAPAAQSAYPAGAPWTLPGTVEVENFDNGGQGVAFNDVTPANEGGQYRSTGVDIARAAGAGNSHVVGWTPAGEWLEYTVNIGATGTYTLETRVAAVGTGGQFRIWVNGVDKSGLLNVPNTGAWNAYQIAQKTGVALSSGIQTVRVEMVTAGTSGHVGAFDWFRAVAETPAVQSAYPAGAPWALPGTVEIENYDLGGRGVAYSDTTPTNEGKQYRTAEGVDIARDAGAGNSHVVGWTKAGEWLEYTVNVAALGMYALETRVAGVGAGGQFRIWINGVDRTGLLSVPNTGAWNAYQIVQKTGVALSSGIQTVRVEMVTAGPSGHVGAFDWFRASSTARRATASSGLRSPEEELPLPEDVRTSQEDQRPGAGWLAVDGDVDTVWQGAPGAGGGWLALTFDPPFALNGLALDWAAHSPTNVQCLYSLDAETWTELVLPLTHGPVDLRYLWLLFPEAGEDRSPALRELQFE